MVEEVSGMRVLVVNTAVHSSVGVGSGLQCFLRLRSLILCHPLSFERVR